MDKELVDATARTGYSLVNSKPKTPQEMAVEYYVFDWEVHIVSDYNHSRNNMTR